ncbi:tail fiber protein [Vibrio phage vB_VhaP_PG11]|nr:tail fiber protein [Vibrio phage vB_VhaP_PG11]
MSITRSKAEFNPATDISNPNLIINGDLYINQRNVFNIADSAYCADRTYLRGVSGVGGSVTWQYHRNDFGNYIGITHSGATGLSYLAQRIEEGNLRRHTSSTQVFTVGIHCVPDGGLSGQVQIAFQLIWRRLSDRAVLQDVISGFETVVASKTRYTASIEMTRPAETTECYLECRVQYRGLSSDAVPDGQYRFWGWKAEKGSVATPFTPDDPTTLLMKCQRYYLQENVQIIAALTYESVYFPVTMRTTPSITLSDGGWSRENGTSRMVRINRGAGAYAGSFTADAEL